MRGFEYRPATSLAQALEWLAGAGDDAHLIAGGTALVTMMKQRLVEPAIVVGLRDVPELRGIRRDAGGGLEIGAMETHRALERSTEVRAHCGALAETFASVATVRIRNQGTVGGNLAHADPAQDPPPMLIALDAEAVIASPGGERTLPLDAFFIGFFETALAPGEILRAVRVPPPAPGARATYVKFLPQSQDDYATISVACVIEADEEQRCTRARIALGGAASVPLRVSAAEDALIGNVLTREAIDEAAALVRDAVDPLGDVRGSAAYKREMARVWTARALRQTALGEVPVAI